MLWLLAGILASIEHDAAADALQGRALHDKSSSLPPERPPRSGLSSATSTLIGLPMTICKTALFRHNLWMSEQEDLLAQN